MYGSEKYSLDYLCTRPTLPGRTLSQNRCLSPSSQIAWVPMPTWPDPPARGHHARAPSPPAPPAARRAGERALEAPRRRRLGVRTMRLGTHLWAECTARSATGRRAAAWPGRCCSRNAARAALPAARMSACTHGALGVRTPRPPQRAHAERMPSCVLHGCRVDASARSATTVACSAGLHTRHARCGPPG